MYVVLQFSDEDNFVKSLFSDKECHITTKKRVQPLERVAPDLLLKMCDLRS